MVSSRLNHAPRSISGNIWSVPVLGVRSWISFRSPILPGRNCLAEPIPLIAYRSVGGNFPVAENPRQAQNLSLPEIPVVPRQDNPLQDLQYLWGQTRHPRSYSSNRVRPDKPGNFGLPRNHSVEQNSGAVNHRDRPSPRNNFSSKGGSSILIASLRSIQWRRNRSVSSAYGQASRPRVPSEGARLLFHWKTDLHRCAENTQSALSRTKVFDLGQSFF